MSAKKILEMLKRAEEKLGNCVPPVAAEQVSWWAAKRPLADVAKADELCRQFSSTHEWPTSANDLRAEIFLRLECARSLASDPGFSDALNLELPDLFLMLVIDFWHGKGAEWTVWRYGPVKPPPSFGKN